MSSLAPVAAAILPFVVFGISLGGELWHKGPEPLLRRIQWRGWATLFGTLLISACAIKSAVDADREKQSAADAQEASAKWQGAMQEKQTKIEDMLASQIKSAEDHLTAGDLRGALERIEQARKFSDSAATNTRIQQVTARIDSAAESTANLTTGSRDDAPSSPSSPSPPPQQVPQPESEQCQSLGNFKFCVRRVSVVPDRIYYAASFTLVVRDVDTRQAPVMALLPMAGASDINIGGLSGWRLGAITGVRGCNSSSAAGCLKLPEQFTTLRDGAVISIKLLKPKNEVSVPSLRATPSADISGQILVIADGKGSIESYGFSQVPVMVAIN